jgi:hypothetical protein
MSAAPVMKPDPKWLKWAAKQRAKVPDDALRRVCAFRGCEASSPAPALDGWSAFAGDLGGLPEGTYCPRHAEALEAVLDGIDDDDDGDEAVAT